MEYLYGEIKIKDVQFITVFFVSGNCQSNAIHGAKRVFRLDNHL